MTDSFIDEVRKELKSGRMSIYEAQDAVRILFDGARASGKTLLSELVERTLLQHGLQVSKHKQYSSRSTGFLTDDNLTDDLFVIKPVEHLLKMKAATEATINASNEFMPECPGVTLGMLIDLSKIINRPEVDMSEGDGFAIEAAEQIAGIETIDDDARTYIVTREQIVKLMTAVRDNAREERYRARLQELAGEAPEAAGFMKLTDKEIAVIQDMRKGISREKALEPFNVNQFIDDEVATLHARLAGTKAWQERDYIAREVGELAREVAFKVIFDKETLIDNLAKHCHAASVAGGWWHDLHTGESLIEKRNKGELLMLMVSEIGEIMEAVRKNLPSDKLPGFTGEEEEAADLLIRLGDYAGARKLRLGAAVVAKMRYNATRADHRPENRRKPGGKAF